MSINKIFWFILGIEGYGVRRSTLSFTQELRKLGVETFFVSMANGIFARELKEKGYQIQIIEDEDIPYFDGSIPEKVLRYVQLRIFNNRVKKKIIPNIKKVRPDIIHVRFNNLVELAGLCGKETGTKTVWHLPGVMSTKKIDPMKWYYQGISKKFNIHILGNSKYTARTILGTNTDIENHYVHLGIEKEQFNPENVDTVSRSNFNIDKEDVVIGIFARLINTKGQDLFIQALSEYVNQNGTEETVHLLLFGGPTEGAFVEEIKSIDLPEKLKVHFMGLVDNPQKYYGICDFTVNSRVGPEPFGLSVIESMIMDKPVLANQKGGPGETILDGKTGWLVEDASINSFKKGLNRAFNDKKRWPEIGKAAREHALSNFTSRVMTENYLKTVNRIL